MKKIILCADDFGWSDAVCQGILKLVQLGRLSAVSCMTNYPAWEKYSEILRKHRGKAMVGLHFNLTQPLHKTIAKCYLGLTRKSEIQNLLQQQYDSFLKKMHTAPQFIDGHQHIHALPVIRDVIIDFCQKNGLPIKMRVTQTPQKSIKAKIINLLGGKRLNRRCRALNLQLNENLLGIYNLSANEKSYEALFSEFLNSCCHNSLIMCHPGEFEKTEPFRQKELQFFMSDEFKEILNVAKFEI